MQAAVTRAHSHSTALGASAAIPAHVTQRLLFALETFAALFVGKWRPGVQTSPSGCRRTLGGASGQGGARSASSVGRRAPTDRAQTAGASAKRAQAAGAPTERAQTAGAPTDRAQTAGALTDRAQTAGAPARSNGQYWSPRLTQRMLLESEFEPAR